MDCKYEPSYFFIIKGKKMEKHIKDKQVFNSLDIIFKEFKERYSLEDKQVLNSLDIISLSIKPNSIAQRIYNYSAGVSDALKTKGNCLQGVRTAMEAAGVVPKDFFDDCTHAYQTIKKFQKSKDFIEVECDCADLGLLPPGAIVVWDHGNGTDAESGHISVSAGGGYEMSDHRCPQNTTGIRPGTDGKEKYGKHHVFLHRDSFYYDPILVEFLKANAKTNQEKIRHVHTLLLYYAVESLGKGRSMGRLVEYIRGCELSYDNKEYQQERKKFYKLVQCIMNSDGDHYEEASINDQEILLKDSMRYQEFFALLSKDEPDTEKVARLFNPYFIKCLREAYNNCSPDKGINAFKGEDGQCYIYTVGKDNEVHIGYNSRGSEKVGIIAAITYLLNKIRMNASLSKEKKDSKLGDEIVSVMSKYIPSLGNYFFQLYQESLKIDKHSSEKEKKLFEKRLKNEEARYNVLQKIYTISGRVSRKFNNAIKKLFGMQKTKPDILETQVETNLL